MNRAGQALLAVRFAIGGAGWARPQLLMNTLGASARAGDDPAVAWITRMVAVRDAALGVGVLCTTGRQRRFWLKVGLACDIGDLVGGIIAARHPESRRSLLKLSPLIGVGLGVAALKQENA